MKVLLSSYWALPFAGGIWTYVDHLQEALLRRGWDVDILTCHPRRPRYYLIRSGRELKRDKIMNLLRPALRQSVADLAADTPQMRWMEMERYGFELAALSFDLTEYDLIHAQDIIAARALSRVKPKTTPLVTTIHGSLSQEFLLHGTIATKTSRLWHYTTALEKTAVEASDTVIVPTRWLQELTATETQAPAAKMQVIPYGLDIDSFETKKDEATDLPAPNDGRLNLICPARLDKVRGHAVLLHALAQLRRHRTDWNLWVVGDGREKKNLRRLCDTLQLTDHVRFLGTRPDVPALLERADIFVLPSLLDNHPFAVMEAQIAGKPIATTDAGGIPEMVSHNQTGLISPAGESAPLADNLARLFDDAALRTRLGEQAQQFGRRQWALDTMSSRTIRVYQKLLTQRGDGGL